ncbi:MAG: hypothetical protein DRO67_00070 [Candidatus Asgardarchaeum californiense]|nr:MAG: hypothetical protein DRO67_00070 [Candidatus Asgardarchaeum californiense]
MKTVECKTTLITNTDREVELTLICSWSPYRPARGPTFSCAGEPPEPEEFDLEEIYIRGLYLPNNHRYYNLVDIQEVKEKLDKAMEEAEAENYIDLMT